MLFRSEADFCLELIAGSNPQYPVAFDMEENRQAALGKTVCTDMAIAFCNKIRAAGYQPMLYTNLNWATNILIWHVLIMQVLTYG